MKNRDVAKITDKYVAQTYARYPIALVRGKGSRVWDADGKEYLDLLAGIAVAQPRIAGEKPAKAPESVSLSPHAARVSAAGAQL